MCTHKAQQCEQNGEFSDFVVFFRPSVVFSWGAYWGAPFSENKLPYEGQIIFQSQLLTPKTQKDMLIWIPRDFRFLPKITEITYIFDSGEQTGTNCHSFRDWKDLVVIRQEFCIGMSKEYLELFFVPHAPKRHNQLNQEFQTYLKKSHEVNLAI